MPFNPKNIFYYKKTKLYLNEGKTKVSIHNIPNDIQADSHKLFDLLNKSEIKTTLIFFQLRLILLLKRAKLTGLCEG
jgi:hypothetical protein